MIVDYYGRFRHTLSFDCDQDMVQEDLMGFFQVDIPEGHSEGDSRDIAKAQIIEQFESVFMGEYGRHGRSYVLRDFGKVLFGKGFLVEEEVYLQEDLERLAEEGVD